MDYPCAVAGGREASLMGKAKLSGGGEYQMFTENYLPFLGGE